MKPFGELELWFVTGAQNLYGESALRSVDGQARQVSAGLNAAGEIPTVVRHLGAITTPEAIRRICLEANATDTCVGVIVWMHTFSPARMWIAGLRALQKPLLHLHTQFNRELPWAEIDMDYMNLNQSAHADREFGFMATRMGVRRRTVVGHWSEGRVLNEIGTWVRAACGWREAQTLRVARFGDNMRDVAVTEGDKVEAQLRLGVSVNGYGVNELVRAMQEATDAEVDRLIVEYGEQYDVTDSLRQGAELAPSLRDAARIEVGARSFLTTGGFNAFTDTFEDLGELPQLPGIAVQRLMADGYGFGAEGDWKAAALLRIVKVMSTGLPGGSSFMEDYTYDLTPGDGKVLGAHMLEVCPSIAGRRPSCEVHPLAIGGRQDPVRLVFDAHGGPAVVVALIDIGDRLRLLVNVVEVVPPDHPLPKLPVARAVWRPQPDLATAAGAWIMAGGPHHTVLTYPLDVKMFEDFAEIAGIELLVIDERTRAREFMKEMWWNEAYYRPVGHF
jgi:L-arabinose isomerase